MFNFQTYGRSVSAPALSMDSNPSPEKAGFYIHIFLTWGLLYIANATICERAVTDRTSHSKHPQYLTSVFNRANSAARTTSASEEKLNQIICTRDTAAILLVSTTAFPPAKLGVGWGWGLLHCLSGVSARALARTLPELHACAPRADILPQQQVVESHSIDHVEQLFEDLLGDLRVKALVAHDIVKCVQLTDDGLQAVQVVAVTHAGGSLSIAHWLHTWQALNALVFQHRRYWEWKSIILKRKKLSTPKKNIKQSFSVWFYLNIQSQLVAILCPLNSPKTHLENENGI